MHDDERRAHAMQRDKQAVSSADEQLSNVSKLEPKLPLLTDVRGLPGLVIYLVTPVAIAAGEASLSHDEYQAISVAAMRSGATIVMSAPEPSRIAALNVE